MPNKTEGVPLPEGISWERLTKKQDYKILDSNAPYVQNHTLLNYEVKIIQRKKTKDKIRLIQKNLRNEM